MRDCHIQGAEEANDRKVSQVIVVEGQYFEHHATGICVFYTELKPSVHELDVFSQESSNKAEPQKESYHEDHDAKECIQVLPRFCIAGNMRKRQSDSTEYALIDKNNTVVVV